MDFDSCRDVDGYWIHNFFHEDNIRSALAYKPRQGDLFLVTYPKCGTTWTQYIILSILTDGNPPKTVVDFELASPFMEMMGAELAERAERPGLLKTHLPFSLQPYSAHAKYIYVTRNPYDVCVSYYYHMKGITAKKFDGSFQRFLKLFIGGKLSCGDYFDHLLSWYEHRNDPNVLFFTYEQMKKDTDLWILKIADFMGDKHGKKLREDPTLLRKVIDTSSLKNMQGIFNEQMPTLIKDLLSLGPDRAVKSLEVYREMFAHHNEPLHSEHGFIRKGIVGDWKAHFTNEQIEDMKAWIARKTAGCDVMDLWKDMDLPRDVDGLWILNSFHEELIRSALAYQPQEDDLFLVTYPKCGTTWTQYLILSILTDGYPPERAVDFMLASPYMEMMGAEAADRMARPGLLKTHLPFSLQPYSRHARYIYVTRNPYDVCVSYYYHMKSKTPKVFEASFDSFCKLFIAGKVPYGDYFDHLLSWYEHRRDPNILFLTYEQLKQDTHFSTLKIAEFMGQPYGKKLREDPTLLDEVIDASSLKNMQGVFNGHMQTIVKEMLNLSPHRAIKAMEVYREIMAQEDEPLHSDVGFVRKGIVGDWKDHFTDQHIRDMKAWITEKTSGSEVMNLWQELDLPL
ncbi:hypothetical protein HPB50_015801 [Hyalomma asiaticum]|uniref:Uncharacterized protein n=1 Tax=Hyalomma asiaticum TaxID=266040 RepID=A0ACB7RWJ0_HYAAI|nr:hypothetical protein HPB50_015801 [Hyalomma asiaticum]